MTPASIVSKIQQILQTSAYLEGYVSGSAILLGVRESITLFPCIIIEPVGNRIIGETYPNEDLVLSVNVTGYIRVFNKDKQLVGSDNTKGVLDFENDIKKTLSSDTTLGLSGVQDTKMNNTIYDFEQYPIRGFGINVEVYYRQNRLTRA